VTIDDIMCAAPLIPVLVLGDRLDPAELARTLVEAGLPVIEVTMRTRNALDAIKAMAAVPGAIVGAGTVLNEAQLAQALDAGSRFIVSPGLTNPLALAARDTGIPFLPGVATPADIMRGLDLGLTRFKFFPAEASGGIPALKALSAPFAEARFCPTGGVTLQSAAKWLELPSVLCVGGTWIARPDDTDLQAIGRRAREAAALATM
jgi:2-dehydro-3-deoxyphosphogluconate aldolase / (4S)-4-hydroxy-2-oxoglutarate aldolase